MQGLQAGDELDPLGRQGRQALQINPLVLKADGRAACRQLSRARHVADGGLNHSSGQANGRILTGGGLNLQRHLPALGSFGKHPGQLAAADDADRRAHAP